MTFFPGGQKCVPIFDSKLVEIYNTTKTFKVTLVFDDSYQFSAHKGPNLQRNIDRKSHTLGLRVYLVLSDV